MAEHLLYRNSAKSIILQANSYDIFVLSPMPICMVPLILPDINYLMSYV